MCAKKLNTKDTMKAFKSLLEEPGQNADYIMEVGLERAFERRRCASCGRETRRASRRRVWTRR